MLTLGADPAPTIQSDTLASRIADNLRHHIVSGQIAPGQRLLMRDLADRFQTSYSPIREAINRLEGEALVEYRPRKGAVVLGLDFQQLLDVYAARRLVEPELVKRAALLHTEENLEEMGKIASELDVMRAAGQGHTAEWYVKHRRFHWLMLEPAANPVLEQTILHWWAISERFHRAAAMLGPLGTPEARFISHETLHSMANDPEEIGYALHGHLRVTQETLRKLYDKV